MPAPVHTDSLPILRYCDPCPGKYKYHAGSNFIQQYSMLLEGRPGFKFSDQFFPVCRDYKSPAVKFSSADAADCMQDLQD